MEEENNNEIVPTGEGNPQMASVCERLFYKTGDPMMYCLSQRLSEPAQQFDNNYAPEPAQDIGMEQ